MCGRECFSDTEREYNVFRRFSGLTEEDEHVKSIVREVEVINSVFTRSELKVYQ